MKRDGFQVELAVEVDRANDVPAGARRVSQPGRGAEFSWGVPGKKSARWARGRRGDSLELGHDPGGMHGEVDGAVSGGRGRRHHRLGRTRGVGLGGREFGAAHVRRPRRQKSRQRARFPPCSSPLFKRERGTRSGERVPQGRACEARCQATRPRRNPLEVSARRCRFTSPRRGFLEGKARRIPPRLERVSRPWLAPRKVTLRWVRCRDVL